jgi:hypothetical protein
MFVNRGPKGSLDPTMPKNTDIEKHRNIEFGLYIHSGDWRKDAWQKATERNFQLKTRIIPREDKEPSKKEDRSEIRLPFSFVSIAPSSVQCGTIKIAEDDQDSLHPSQYILRLIERSGQISTAQLSFANQFEIQKAEMVDLLEFQPQPVIEFTDHSVSMPIKPYEILTLKIWIKH